MKKAMTAAAMAVFLCTLNGVAQAAEEMSREAQQAVTRIYKNAKTEVLGTQTINGVRAYNVRVSERGGPVTALVTESGDFLLSGVPQRRSEVPPAVRETINELFKGVGNRPPMLYTITLYQIDVESRGQIQRVDIDAAGRLRDVADAREDSQAANYAKGDPKAIKDVDKLIQERYPGAKFTDMLQGKQDKDSFIAHFELGGQRGWLLLDKSGEILGSSLRIDPKDLPKAVRDTVERNLASDRIKAVRRLRKEFYQYEIPSATGGEMARVKVLANGDVWQIVNPMANQEEQAITAGHGEKPR